MSGGFHRSLEDGVAVFDWQASHDRINLLDLQELDALERAVEDIRSNDSVRAAVIGTTRPDLGGGIDLAMLEARARETDATQGFLAVARRLHQVYRRLETCGKPVGAATPGAAVGGVFELMLACHRRFAAPNPSARIGLPEIRIGLFPAAGGTTRLMRRFGLAVCGRWLLEGRLFAPAEAAEVDLVDEVDPSPMRRAIEWARTAGPEEALQPWDRPGHRIPGGAPYSRHGFDNFVGAAVIANTRGRGNYPAVDALLQALYEGSLLPFEAALELEARLVAGLLAKPQTRAMTRTAFVSRQQLRAGARRPSAAPKARQERIAVIGAGMMGAGIAYVAAKAGKQVVLLDRNMETAMAGRQAATRRAAAAVKRGRLPHADADALVNRISAETELAAVAGAELVIEAVFEDPKVKQAVLAEAARHADGDAIIASNTSTLPITELAGAVPASERFLGLHFFSPVERMELVEVIRGKMSSDPAVAAGMDFARSLGKTPILVRDARFFYANRCIIPYTLEAAAMVAEGVNPSRIEQAALAAGMPVGCLQLIDETSVELGAQILQATRAALGASHVPHPGEDVFTTLAFKEQRLGRKVGAGFYDYSAGKRTRLWPGIARIWPPAGSQPSLESLGERLLAVQAVEAMRALEEGVLEDVREGDVGAVLGWGFAPWSGGPFSWLDLMGSRAALDCCERLATAHGPRFRPPSLLRGLARSGKTFYGRFGKSR